MTLFLRMKAWQLFLLLLLPHLILLPIEVMTITASPEAAFSQVSLLMTVRLLLPFMIFIGWVWSAVVFLNGKIPLEIRPKRFFFKLGIGYNAVVMPIAVVAFVLAHQSGMAAHGLIAYQLPFIICWQVCFFYICLFFSKNLLMAELEQSVGFLGGYAGVVILLLLLPVGIWVIQPRVNKLATNQ